MNLQPVFSQFAGCGTLRSVAPIHAGHIHGTWRVESEKAAYILQRMSEQAFGDIPALMENIGGVTEYLKQSSGARRTLSLVPLEDGGWFFEDGEASCWRLYEFLEGCICVDVVESPEQAFQAAQAFGDFHARLRDFPAETLHETIPDFHCTPRWLEKLNRAVAQDSQNRLCDVKNEVDFVLDRSADIPFLDDRLQRGELPLRVTHNDTKINNVLLDQETGEWACVIDLDTVMPGLVHYDFGDMMRTFLSPAAEDEPDLSSVELRMDVFEALAAGYLSRAGSFLTPLEIEHLVFSGKLITLEIGMRFLIDHLQGDSYFKTQRPGQNLDRCRTQFRLVELIEEQQSALQAVVMRLTNQS